MAKAQKVAKAQKNSSKLYVKRPENTAIWHTNLTAVHPLGDINVKVFKAFPFRVILPLETEVLSARFLTEF